MRLLIVSAFGLLILLFSLQTAMGEVLIYGSSHYPPMAIESNNRITEGIDIEIAKEIAKYLKLELKIVRCPWARCLYMLKDGQIDITGSTLRNAERESYLLYIDPPYISESNFVFYLPKGKKSILQKYEDLHKLSAVGVVRGSKYIHRFDSDLKIKKHNVTNENQLLHMLEYGRIDTFIAQEIIGDYLIKSAGFTEKFIKADLTYTLELPTYFVLSKKSIYANQVDDFNRILTQMYSENRIKDIVERYTK